MKIDWQSKQNLGPGSPEKEHALCCHIGNTKIAIMFVFHVGLRSGDGRF
jgi:hypothetical protein